MHIPGHIAIAISQHGLPPLSNKSKLIAPLLIAAVFPDIIDKIVGYVLHIIPGGRHMAHNIFSLIGTSLLVSLVWETSTGMAWFLGYLGHLVADNPRRVPWFFPAKKYPFRSRPFYFDWQQFFRECLFLTLALLIYVLRQPGTRGNFH